MTLNVIPGDSSANSYVSQSESDSYFAVGYKKELWIGITNSDKENLLIESTRLLDQFFNWTGRMDVNSTQSLRWPRLEAYDIDQRLIGNKVIPAPIKYAVCELAYFLYSGDGFGIGENTLDKLKVGPITLDFSKTVKTPAFPKIVTDTIGVLGYCNSLGDNSVKIVNLVRT